jgi:hypothetical protein
MLTIVSQAEGLTVLTQEWCSRSTELSNGGGKFDWFAVCVFSPDWRCHKLETCEFWLGTKVKPSCLLGRGMQAVYPGICLTIEEKSQKNLSQGIRKVFSCLA